MDPATIVAIIGVAISAISSVAKAIPDKSDYWRQNRLKELQTLVQEGLTPAEEDQLRSLGLSGTQQAEKEMRSRRADALAQLQGGATAQDIRAAEASDMERSQRARLAVENEIIKQDIAAKQRYRAEQAGLMEKQHNRAQEQRQAIGQAAEKSFQDIYGIATARTVDKREGTGATPEEVTGRAPTDPRARRAANAVPSEQLEVRPDVYKYIYEE